MNSCFLIIIILLFCNCGKGNNGCSFGWFGNNGCSDNSCNNNLIEPRNNCDSGCDRNRDARHSYPTYGNCNTCGCESDNN